VVTMEERQRGRSGESLSIKNIYVGSLDTTMELNVGGAKSSAAFINSYFIKNQNDLDEFIGGSKFFVFGQKGAGKTAFLRYAGEMIKRSKRPQGAYVLYRFRQDFPTQAHKDITEYVYRRRKKEHESDNDYINIFRDMDYEDFWMYIILERVNNFLSTSPGDHVVRDANFARFQEKLKNIDRGTIMDRISRLVPKSQAPITSGDGSGRSDDFEWGESSEHFNKFSEYVLSLKQAFASLRWSSGYVNFMFDEIDPNVGSGKSFQLDCILIRDLIVTIYNLNCMMAGDDKKVVFSAAIRSEVLMLVERLGKEIHKILGQFGINMTWGEYGRMDIHHPLVKMICKKIQYSEQLYGFGYDDGEDQHVRIWRKYFRKNKTEELSPKYLLDQTWLKPRDTVLLLKHCQELDGNKRAFEESLIFRSRKLYANSSWRDIAAQLTTVMSPEAIDALDVIFSGYRDRFSKSDIEVQIQALASVSASAKKLWTDIPVGDLLQKLYLHGVLVSPTGSRYRAFFRGDEAPNVNATFSLHPALTARFSNFEDSASPMAGRNIDQFDLDL
jgi:hypothetical protein